jgi:addiction module HigA family antidote
MRQLKMNIKNAMRPVHPGEILREELEALEMSANSLATALGVPGNRITAILNGQRGITADTALRLSRYLGTTAEFWVNLQKAYELRLAERDAGKQIQATVNPRTEAA